jgi:hypothetical protein
MPGGLGPRFVLEAGFLILLAAVATYARLDAAVIVAVMAGGWLLAAVFEVLAARRERLYPGATWERRTEAEAERARPAEEAVEPTPPTAEPQEAAVAQVQEETAEPEPAPPPAPRVDDEATGEIELPKRRWWFRRPVPEPEPPPAIDAATARPSARHVRLIRGTSSSADDVEERKDVEAGS